MYTFTKHRYSFAMYYLEQNYVFVWFFHLTVMDYGERLKRGSMVSKARLSHFCLYKSDSYFSRSTACQGHQKVNIILRSESQQFKSLKWFCLKKHYMWIWTKKRKKGIGNNKIGCTLRLHYNAVVGVHGQKKSVITDCIIYKRPLFIINATSFPGFHLRKQMPHPPSMV